MRKVMFLFVILICFNVYAEIEMNRFEADVFKQELDLMNNDPGPNFSGFNVWRHFFYPDDSEYRNPGNRGNGGTASKAHETQGLANIHEIDRNGNIVPEYWVLIKNTFVDVSKINNEHFFEVYDKKNVLEREDEKFGDGDFYYEGYSNLPKALVFPGKDKLYFSSNVYYDHTFYTVSEKVDFNGITPVDFNKNKEWSYLAIFPKTGMIFKPREKITWLEGHNLITDRSPKVLGRRADLKLRALTYDGDELRVSDLQQDNVDSWIQGGAFSPNGRFFYNVHDDDEDNVNYTGIYIYYVPEPAYRELLRTKEWQPNDLIRLKFYMIGFIHIAENMEPCGVAQRNMELEGIDIFPALDGGEEYDIHLLVLNNTCQAAEETHAIFHYKSGDYDDDGIKDVYDNCPFTYNPEQEDEDGNGLGDFCDYYDPDGDGLFEEDNCPETYNPDQGDYDGDGVGNLCDPCPSNGRIFEYDPRQDSDGDRIHDECDNCPNVKNEFVATSLHNELISAEVQECDDNDNWLECLLKFSFSGGASKNQERKSEGYLGNLIYKDVVYKNRKVWYWQPDHDLDGVGDACDDDYSSVTKLVSTTSPDLLLHRGKSQVNRYVDLSYKVIGDTGPGSTAKYCWLDLDLIDDWGKDGYCTTSDNKRDFSTINDSSFGYSHGGDPEPFNRQLNRLAWKTPELSSRMGKISVENKSGTGKSVIEKWDWTRDLAEDYERLYTTYVSSGQENLKDPFINYVVSVGSAGTENCSVDEDYYNGETEFINPNCFRSLYINARAKRESKKGTELGYYTENINFDFFSKLVDSGMLKVPQESQKTCTGCAKFSDITKGVVDLWRYRDNILTSEPRKLAMGENKIAEFNDNGDMLTFFENDGYIFMGMNTEDNPAETVVAGIAQMPQETLAKGKGAIADGKIYLAGENMLYRLEKDNGSERENDLAYRLEEVVQLPYPVESISFFGVGEELVMLHDNGSFYEPYLLYGEAFEKISSDEYPASRDMFSFSADKWKMYVAGGVTEGRESVAVHGDVWSLDTTYGWKKIADDISIDMADVLIKEENEILNIFSRTFPEKEVSTAFINIATGETDYGKTVLESEFEASDIEKYCISRKNDNAYPGKEFRNICSPVEDYQYKSYTFLDYKFSLAGIDNFVFSGGLSGIRTFRINASGGLEKRDLDVIGMVNSLAVKDNALYASRSNRVFVFEVKEDGNLVKRKEIKTSGCDQIRVSENMLFTGENGKVNIYDITDPFNPVKKYKVPLSMNVVDLEVWNEYLFVFHDKWFSSSKFAMFKFLDDAAPVKTDEIKLSCSDPEFVSDSQNIYLGCRNGQKKIEFNENEKLVVKSIGGSKNYFRDTYLRNSIIYTVHSGRIFLSR